MPRQSTNLYLNRPGNYIYLLKNGRFCAYKRYPDPSYGIYQPRKFFQKAALFYTYEEAVAWLESLPEKMDRPFRNANVEY